MLDASLQDLMTVSNPQFVRLQFSMCLQQFHRRDQSAPGYKQNHNNPVATIDFQNVSFRNAFNTNSYEITQDTIEAFYIKYRVDSFYTENTVFNSEYNDAAERIIKRERKLHNSRTVVIRKMRGNRFLIIEDIRFLNMKTLTLGVP